jgi:hypothetical protein
MTNDVKALRLACWNPDGVRGRKLELEHFFSQHGVDICLLTETHVQERVVFQSANCLSPNRPAHRGRGNSNPSPSEYRSLRCPRPQFDPVRGNCLTYYVG